VTEARHSPVTPAQGTLISRNIPARLFTNPKAKYEITVL
jgi:hypothetical protein